MRRRPRSWPQVLSFGELPGLAATNGLRAAGAYAPTAEFQLPPSPRDLRGDLRDQPRTAAPPRGALRDGRERNAFLAYAPIDVGLGGVLLANMLEGWLDGNPTFRQLRRQPMNPKIREHHRSKPAYIYLRQSTPGQVRHHQESTERQYALREKALELGWSESLIRILWTGPGQDGTEMAGREDFKTLVADVSMGQVGAVFALEVSRLARSNLDWHRCWSCVRSPNSGDRRRWLLRSSGLQRRIVARVEGHNGSGRTTFLARAPPGRQAQ